MSINFKKLVESVKAHGQPALNGLKEALQERAMRPHELDLGKLFVECFGWHDFSACRDNKVQTTKVMETAGAVSSDAFLNITQQFAYSAILQAYDVPERPFCRLIPSRPSRFKWERVPGISHIGDEALVVDEGKEFPIAGVAEDWIDTPETRKRGMRIPVSKEAIFFDQTAMVLERCSQVGDWLGVNKEKRAITCVVDAGETDQVQYRYNWRNTKYATYQTSTPWICRPRSSMWRIGRYRCSTWALDRTTNSTGTSSHSSALMSAARSTPSSRGRSCSAPHDGKDEG